MKDLGRNFTGSNGTSRKKSMDTRATDDREGIILPDISADDDSLIGDQENSLIADSNESRVHLIRQRRQQERDLDRELAKMEQMIAIE